MVRLCVLVLRLRFQSTKVDQIRSRRGACGSCVPRIRLVGPLALYKPSLAFSSSRRRFATQQSLTSSGLHRRLLGRCLYKLLGFSKFLPLRRRPIGGNDIWSRHRLWIQEKMTSTPLTIWMYFFKISTSVFLQGPMLHNISTLALSQKKELFLCV